MTSINADTVGDSASIAINQLERTATPLIRAGKHQAGVLLDQSGELIDKVSSRASENIADLGSNVISYTRKNPLAALLLALGAGALIVTAAKSLQSRQ